MTPTQLRAIVVVLLLAALAYLLYLWSRRKDQIACPSCGGRVNLYAEECPHCGHERGAAVDAAAADDDADAAESDDYTELVAKNTVAEVKARVDEDGLHPAKVLEAEQANDDRVTLKNWLEDRIEVYNTVSDSTVAHVEHLITDGQLDPATALAAERHGKNRKTLIEWLEEQN